MAVHTALNACSIDSSDILLCREPESTLVAVVNVEQMQSAQYGLRIYVLSTCRLRLYLFAVSDRPYGTLRSRSVLF
jgi:hypothetical protein